MRAAGMNTEPTLSFKSYYIFGKYLKTHIDVRHIILRSRTVVLAFEVVCKVKCPQVTTLKKFAKVILFFHCNLIISSRLASC